jgi:hypothetical protein
MSDVSILMNTKAVQRAVNKTAPKTLLQSGRYIWGIARSLIKQRSNPDVSSTPGTPVHSHRNAAGAGFRKTIVYALAPDKKSVVIGPKLVSGGLTDLARGHEFGGGRWVNKVDPELSRGVKIGDVAPVTWKHMSRGDITVKKDSRPDPRTGRSVQWIRIRTKSQAAHATRLYRRMMKKYREKQFVYYPARPYMRPALELGRSRLSGLWKNSVKP